MKNLIVIEGTDGSGKQTQSEKLREYFKKNNIECKNYSFPNYESSSSALVKMYLNGEFGDNAMDVNPYIASCFFAVDRYATFKKEIKQNYDNGDVILLDRYTTANMIHQASKIFDEDLRTSFLDWLYDLEFNKFELPVPNLVFFLNMPPKYSQELMKDRKNKITNETKKDIHENDSSYLEKCYNTSFSIAKKYNWIIIDCVEDGKIKSIEQIHEEIVSYILSNLNL